MGSNKYKIEFDNKEKLTTYDDVILKNNLLFNKEVDNELLNELINQSDYYANYNRVLKYINTKIRSEIEIKEYLNKLLINNKDKKIILDELKKNKLINDEYFCKAFISDKIRLSTMGPNKIKQELIKHNIDLNLIDRELESYNKKEIDDKLEKLIIKKINLNKKYSNYILKQKLISYFIDLGYYKDDIGYLIDKNLKEDNETIKKEYEKQYKKLSKKYVDEELKFNLYQKLYQKGYSKEEIEKISG